MKFFLARHAEAEDGEQMDPTRGLTKTGEAQIPVMADFLKTQTNRIGLVACSNMKRGKETAAGLADALDCDLRSNIPQLDPDATPAAAWKKIRQLAGALDDDEELLVISHGPLINALAAHLLKSGEGDKFHFTHGAIAHFDTSEPDPATGYPVDGRGGLAYMHWLVTPKLMNRAMQQDRKAVVEAGLKLADSLLESLGLLLDEAKGEYYYEDVEQKRWVLGDGGQAGNCDVCEGNEAMGLIDMDDGFEGVDGIIDEPPAHPNCTCTVEQVTRRQRVYV